MDKILVPKVDRVESTPDMAWESDEARLNTLEDEVFVKVEFLVNGYIYNTQLFASGGKANEPSEPKLTGKVFDGWFSDSEFTTEFDFNTEVTSDLVLYSKWSEE